MIMSGPVEVEGAFYLESIEVSGNRYVKACTVESSVL